MSIFCGNYVQGYDSDVVQSISYFWYIRKIFTPLFSRHCSWTQWIMYSFLLCCGWKTIHTKQAITNHIKKQRKYHSMFLWISPIVHIHYSPWLILICSGCCIGLWEPTQGSVEFSNTEIQLNECDFLKLTSTLSLKRNLNLHSYTFKERTKIYI